MTLDPVAGLAGLFVSAFLSSTLLPGSSEIVIAALVADRPELAWPAIGLATLGNTLGGLTSYGVGRLVPTPRSQEGSAARALALARRFGVSALLFSWVPLVGDALCVASGWLRHNVAAAALAIATGKFVRYVVLVWGVRSLAV